MTKDNAYAQNPQGFFPLKSKQTHPKHSTPTHIFHIATIQSFHNKAALILQNAESFLVMSYMMIYGLF